MEKLFEKIFEKILHEMRSGISLAAFGCSLFVSIVNPKGVFQFIFEFIFQYIQNKIFSFSFSFTLFSMLDIGHVFGLKPKNTNKI